MKTWLASALFIAWALPAQAQSSPFYGTAATVPGTIEAEDFDNGGEAVAYHDTTTGNQLGAYRTAVNDDVDIEAASEHGFDVGKIRLGEWLNYSVNVLSAGSYTLTARVSCVGQGGTFHIEFNGVNVTGAMAIPDTGGWQTWTTIAAPVTLTAGTQIMKVVVDTLGSSTALGNWNYFTLATNVPATVEAENFDNGGEGIAYHDTTAGNQLGAYRTGPNDNVDIEASSEHGFDVGKIRLGEWLNYSVNVAAAGSYTLSARVSSLGQGGTFHVEFNGSDATGPMVVPDTGGWQTWTTLSVPVTLSAGTQVMRVVVDALGGTSAFGNLNYFGIAANGSGTEQVTVVHWNIHKGREECTNVPHNQCRNTLDDIATYLTTNNADVVSLNEVAFNRSGYVDSNGNPEDQPAVLEQKLEAKTGQCWERVYADEDAGTTGDHGNLLLWRSSDDVSCGQPGRFHKQGAAFRLPLPQATDGGRSVAGVTLIVGSRPVTFFTTHLCAPPNAVPSCVPSERETQVNALKTSLANFAAPRVIGGDFNASPTSTEISLMTPDYFDLWADAVNAGTATPNNINEPTHNAGWRPDYIFRSKDTMVSLVNAKIEHPTNPQTQVAYSDHFPMTTILRVQ